MVNRVILLGRLGRDPEVRETSGGTKVANFSIATDETFKDRNGEKQKRTDWHKLVLWDKLAEIAEDYLHRGDLIYIEGKIQSRQYEKDGTPQTVVEIIVNSLKMVSTQRNEDTPTPRKPEVKTTTRSRVREETEDETVAF